MNALADFRKVLAGITRPSRDSLAPTNPHSGVAVANRLRVQVVGPDEFGRQVTKQETPWVECNILNTFGLASIASRLATNNFTTSTIACEIVSAMRIGTGTTAATSTDASLVASTGSVSIGQPNGMTKSQVGAMTVEYQATFLSNNPPNTATINEVALYCNSTADSQVFARAVLGNMSVSKGNSDNINISYDVIMTTK
jgi:hypothetical protein